jgi:hypothetical protein
VLEVAARVADELVRAAVLQEPGHGGIGQGMVGQDFRFRGQIGRKRTVELEDRLGRQPLQPEGLGAGEGAKIKVGPAVVPMAFHDRRRHRMFGQGQEGTGFEILTMEDGSHKVPK